jgi:hypothetical protein
LLSNDQLGDRRQSINQPIDQVERIPKQSIGPAISDEGGVIFSSRAMDNALHEVLEDLFETKRSLFPPTIASVNELRKLYQVFRSFRRSSDTRALVQRVVGTDIDIINRWASFEKGKRQEAGPRHAELLC